MGFYETQEANYEYRKNMRESYDEGYEAGYKQGKVDALEICPVPRRGKWNYFGWYSCSECGYERYEKSKFCPDCGADMRGDSK